MMRKIINFHKLLILLCLFLASLSVRAEESALKLHFYPPDAWEGPIRIHLWGGERETRWPGLALQPEGDGWWGIQLEGVRSTRLIFNNDGRQQTADLTRSSEGWYRLGQWHDQKPVAVSESGKKLRLFFRPPSSISEPPNIYFWEVWPEGPSTSWPGEAMKSESDGWFSYALPVERANVIFNDGHGWQSANLFRDKDGFFQEDHWFDARPEPEALFVEARPSVDLPYAYPIEKTLKIQIVASKSAQKIRYRIDGGAWLQATQTELEFGENWAPNQKVTLELEAVGKNGKTFKVKHLYEKSLLEKDRHPFDRLRIYQVMVEAYRDGDPARGFGVGYGPSAHLGDLKGVLAALDEIAALHVNALWLTPVFESGATTPLAATGYFPTDYFAVDPHFGTFEDLKAVVDGAHARGLYVFFDGVFGHNGGDVRPSPQGRRPKGRELVDYTDAETLDFYKEVATYWIEKLGIDGWRVDQAYQVPVAAWAEIRTAVETASKKRRERGETFGTLGFMVGEVWKGADEIRRDCFGGFDLPKALPGCFDFPVRYRLVQSLAVQEHAEAPGAQGQPASGLAEALETHRAYPPHAHPVLMLGNHDLVRFGDLIERAGYPGPDDESYWARHRAAFSFLAAYSGPISIYYGDEVGANVPGFVHEGDGGWRDDHVSRDSGERQLSANALALRQYVSDLMALRDRTPALWSGSLRIVWADETLLVEEKTLGDEKILYFLNLDTQERSFSWACEESKIDLLTGQKWASKAGQMTVKIPGLSGVFLK